MSSRPFSTSCRNISSGSQNVSTVTIWNLSLTSAVVIPYTSINFPVALALTDLPELSLAR